MTNQLLKRRTNIRVAVAAVAALALVAVAARWLSGNDRVVERPETVIHEGLRKSTPYVAVLGEDALVEPGDTTARAAATNSQTSSLARRASTSRKERSAAKRAAREAKKRAEGPEDSFDPSTDKVTIRALPTIFYDAVPDLRREAKLTLYGGTAGNLHQTVSGTIGDIQPVSLGSFMLHPRRNVDFALSVRVDHPDAMPETVQIFDHVEWVGTELLARPRVRLRPIRSRVTFAQRAASTVSAGPSSARRFDGSVRLLRLGAFGKVEYIDGKSMPGGRGSRRTTLRFDGLEKDVILVGIPTSPSASADFVRLRVGNDDEFVVDTMTRCRFPRPLMFRVLDPFGQPMAGVGITATIDERSVAVRETTGGAPVVIDGHVFCKATDELNAAGYGGQRVNDGDVSEDALGLFRMLSQAESGGDGTLSLPAIAVGLYEFNRRDPLGGGDFLLDIPILDHEGTHNVAAPVVGIEVLCPASWREKEDGLAAWKSAVVKVTGTEFRSVGGRERAEILSTGTVRRFLVQPNTPFKVTVKAKGRPECTAFVTAQPPGSLTGVLPSRIKVSK